MQKEDELASFAHLPSEIAIHVLSFLPLSDILTVCLVNKQWHAYAVSNEIWRNFYHQKWERLPLAPSFLESFEALEDHFEDETPKTVGDVLDEKEIDTHTSPATSRLRDSSFVSLYDTGDLRTTFKHKYYLEKNWLNGKYSKQSFLAHPDHAINCIKFSSRESGAMLFTGADDNTIKVWKPSAAQPRPKELTESKKEAGFSLSASLNQLSLSISSSWSPTTAKREESPRKLNMSPTLENTFTGHTSLVWCLDYDKHTLVSGGHDCQMIVWTETGELVHAFKDVLEGGINGLTLHHSKVFLTGKNCKSIKLMDIEAQKLIREWQEATKSQGVFTYTACFEDNLALTSDSSYLRFWDLRLANCQSVKKIPVRTPRFEVLQVKQGTTLLATGDADGDIIFWDYRKFGEEGAENAKLKRYSHGLAPISDLFFDNHKLVSADKKGAIKMWRLTDEDNAPARCTIPLDIRLWCFQSDDRALVCGDRDGNVHMLDFGDIEQYLQENNTAKQQEGGCMIQ